MNKEITYKDVVRYIGNYIYNVYNEKVQCSVPQSFFDQLKTDVEDELAELDLAKNLKKIWG